MNAKNDKHISIFSRSLLLLFAVAVVASCLFLLCYRYDNKYTAPGNQPIEGVLTLNEVDLLEHPMTFLVRDWEIYRGKLLSPEIFLKKPPIPDELTFIGQYGGFEGKDKTASPHGSATYRLRMILPKEMRSYTLELPEIYSAYRLYINGALMKQMGDPEPASYRAQTGNTTITVQAANSLEILLAVSDYSYFYSGMLYPPAFGESTAVFTYLNLRYGLRIAALAVALCVGLLSLCIGAMTKLPKRSLQENHLTLLYSLLCFCFVGYSCYPVVKTLLAGGMQWYYLENFFYIAILVLIMLIQHHISGFGGKITAAFVSLGVFVCCCVLLVTPFLAGNLTLMMAYSKLLKLFTLACAAFLSISTVYSLFNGTIYSLTMLTGMVVFDCSLIFDQIYAGHEPILIGRFREIDTGILIVLIGIIMAKEIAQQYRMRLVLEDQMNNVTRIMEMQSAYYPILLEKEQESKVARHDLRHHLLMLRELAVSGNINMLISYLDEYDVAHLQQCKVSYCNHYVVNMLLRLYTQMADKRQITMSFNIKIPEELNIGNVDLCIIISNLLENALEACEQIHLSPRWIHVGMGYKTSRLSIVVDNSFDGVINSKDGQYISRKRKDSVGIGLASIQAVADRYKGSTAFSPDEKQPIFHSEVLLVIRANTVEPDVHISEIQ